MHGCTARLPLALALIMTALNPTRATAHGGSDNSSEHGTADARLADLARAREIDSPLWRRIEGLLSGVISNAYAAVGGNPSVYGEWGPIVAWPFAFASAANLPDGRILTWGANNTTSFTGGTSTFATVWDPDTGQFLARNHTTHSMFCGIPTLLEDGRVFVNGGDGTRERTSTFNFRTNAWTQIDSMNVGRWYNGAVAMPDGAVFTALGDPGSPYPEIWRAGQGWTYLNGANLQSPILNFTAYQHNWLPYFHLAPDGRIFHSGPTTQMNWLGTTANGNVSPANLTNAWYPKYSTGVMYDEGRILVAGGAQDGNTQPATARAMTLDIRTAVATKTEIRPMAFARKFNNGVVLPTGEVLVIGGNTSGVEFSDNGTNLTPEIWNPGTGLWRQAADHAVPRNYHSIALLLPDGRVFSGGGGLCACAADHPDAQVYSPPYLFNSDGSPAVRPEIITAPATVTSGRTITVSATPGLSQFSLIKMSGITHNLNSDLRRLQVSFVEVASGQYELAMHTNRNVLTPGYWMLFGLDSRGVPSKAKVLQVSTANAPTVTQPGEQVTVLNSRIDLPVVATDPNGDPLTFSAQGLPPGVSINSSTGVISGVPNVAGGYRVNVTVSDGTNAASASFGWNVYVATAIRYVKLEGLSEVNNNPWASAAEINLLGADGQALNRSGWLIQTDSEETQGENGRAVNAFDGNLSTIWHTQWSAASPTYPHWLIMDMRQAQAVTGFTYLARQDATFNGTIQNYRLYVSTDGVTWGAPLLQGSFAATKTAQTASIPLNRAPTLSLPANQTSTTGATVQLPLQATDADGDALSFSATGLPTGLAINAVTGLISGVPTTAGSYSVAVRVQDPAGASANATFFWQVTSPALTVQPLRSAPKPTDTVVNYQGVVTHADGPRFKWLFGDGSAETVYSSSATISHTFTQPGLYVVRLTVTDSRNIEQSTTFVQAVHRPLTGNPPLTSSNILWERTGTVSTRLWVVNQDNNSVTVFDAVTNAKLKEIAVGNAPRSIAKAPDGRIWVINKLSATASVIDPVTLTSVQTVNLPAGSQPFGIVFAPNSQAAYVTLEGLGQLLTLDPLNGTVMSQADIGANPRHLAVTGDSAEVLVSRFVTPPLPGEHTATVVTNQAGAQFGAVVVPYITATRTVGPAITLRHSDKVDTENQGRGVPNYLGAPAIAPDGLSAWVPSKQDNVKRGVLRDGNPLNFQNTVRAIASRIDLASHAEDYTARIDFDNAGVASAAVFDPTGSYLFVALETNRQIAVVDAYGQREITRFAVGRAPQGLAISDDGLTLFVNNFMDRSVTVHDLSNLMATGAQNTPTLATLVSITTDNLSATVLKGKQLFYDAQDPRLARDSYISCASCHNDGGHDGRVWDLTGAGEGLRNTISLRGHGGMTQGFLHWSANFDEVQDFEGQIRDLAGGVGLLSDADFTATQSSLGPTKAGRSIDLDALAAYIASLDGFAASPYRQANGSLSATAAAGKALFASAQCGQCHGGNQFSDSGAARLHNVGTLKAASGGRLGGTLSGLDTPTLREVWATAPYLHDGSAATLADAINAHTALNLSGVDVNALGVYLLAIDGTESAPANLAPVVAITAPANGSAVSFGTAITLTASVIDSDSAVSRVEFYDGTSVIASVGTSPYTSVWTGAGAGTHSLTVRAYDVYGAVATSAPVNITVTVQTGSGTGLLGQYFNNINLTGAPALQRSEKIDFDWGTAAPASGVTVDNFSIRWSGWIEAPVTGSYQFQTVSDDGVRLSVNNTRIIDNWTQHAVTVNNSASLTMTAGQRYPVTVEHYDGGGNAVAKLLWKRPGDTAFQTVPVDRLYGVSNLAQGRAAKQSSTYTSSFNPIAAKAVDGNINGALSSGSVTHTSYNTNAWWQVDLGTVRAINNIQLWNRTDCCASRLSNFYVFVSSTDMTGRTYSSLVNDPSVWRYRVGGTAPRQMFLPADTTGRYVRVQLAGTNYLSLAEVQVYGR